MKVALITGAARGIGAATAKEFAQAGYALALLDLDGDEVRRTGKKLEETGAEVLTLETDLSSLEQIEKAVAQTAERWGRIDALINNAATRELETIREITPKNWQRAIDVNLTAPAFLTKWCAPYMKTHGGVIINITSVEAHIPKGVCPVYAATKAGLLGLTWEMANALAGDNIRVIALSPGAIATDFGADYSDGKDDQPADPTLSKDMRDYSETVIPMQRWGTVEEVARTVRWLASDEASYINSTEITVDGGLRHTWMTREIKNRIRPGEFE
jgi:NAD(P)-dependent dehydrogenase (short-subunit alcohol dehydrogenase family)